MKKLWCVQLPKLANGSHKKTSTCWSYRSITSEADMAGPATSSYICKSVLQQVRHENYQNVIEIGSQVVLSVRVDSMTLSVTALLKISDTTSRLSHIRYICDVVNHHHEDFHHIISIFLQWFNDSLIFISNCDCNLYDIYTSYSFRLTCRATIGIQQSPMPKNVRFKYWTHLVLGSNAMTLLLR